MISHHMIFYYMISYTQEWKKLCDFFSVAGQYAGPKPHVGSLGSLWGRKVQIGMTVLIYSL